MDPAESVTGTASQLGGGLDRYDITFGDGELAIADLELEPQALGVVQVGTQQRSMEDFQTAIELVRNGRIGKLKQVWVALPYFTTKGGPYPTTPAPKSMDWDLYQGQAPVNPYCVQRTHSNFRWWYEYSGGKLTDWGAHHVDIACWAIGASETGPSKVTPLDYSLPVEYKDGHPPVSYTHLRAHETDS